MAMPFSDVQTICQEAFYILRQDATVLTEANWSAGKPIEVAKCRLAVETAANEVIDAFQWRNTLTVANIATWPAKVRNACVYCLCRELAIPIAGRIEDMKNYDALYRDKLLQAKLTDLNKTLSYNTDPVLSQLVMNFKSDDPALVTAYSVYAQRVTAVRDTSKFELMQTLGIDTIEAKHMHLLDALVVAKLAAACGFGPDFAQLKAQEYQAKLAEFRRNELNRALASNDDPVLAELLANFRNDDPGLVNAYEVYTKRSATVKAECDAEVKAMLGVDTLDDLARQISNCLAVSRLANVCGLGADVKQLKSQEYVVKVQEWRKLALNNALASNTDPILAELLANFRSDDAGLVNAYAIYTNRVSVVKETATTEVNAAHDWLTPFTSGDKEHRAYPAWIDLCCAKLAAACGLDANHVSIYEKKYQTRLTTARAADLEAAKATVTDEDTKHILAMISTNFVPGDGLMPRNIKAITDRIDEMKDSARREVILAHDWNFAKCVVKVADECRCDGHPYHHSADYPLDALRLIAVYGCGGDLVEWKVENGKILARSSIHMVKYTKDVTDFSLWSEFARRPYYLRLAADVARTVMNNLQDVQILEQKYNLALEDAKLRDTREGNTPTDAWGPNHYVDMMRGARRRPWEV